jgi:signal transduction histidine kinase
VANPKDVAIRLLSLPPELAAVRQSRPHAAAFSRVSCFEYDIVRSVRTAQAGEASERLAATLDAKAFLTVPMRYRGETIGRLFVTSARRCFEESDVFFLVQVFEHFMPVIDNIRLVDRMAADAGVAERKKIARDLHDSVIQPYIGLKMGIGCLRQKLEAGTLQLSDVDRLIAINEEAIADLRRYVSVLKGQAEEDEDFISAVKRFAAKFSFATGISVDVEADDEMKINSRLAAESFQIVAEGLSNIRRHTDSMKARVCIRCADGQLAMRIIDMGNSGGRPEPFVPWSIAERAEELGGNSRVEPSLQGGSTVVIEVPL